jgi:hypothetical protein
MRRALWQCIRLGHIIVYQSDSSGPTADDMKKLLYRKRRPRVRSYRSRRMGKMKQSPHGSGMMARLQMVSGFESNLKIRSDVT